MIGGTHGEGTTRRYTESRASDTIMAPATRLAPFSRLVKTEQATRALPPAISAFITRSFTSRSSRRRDRGQTAWAIGGMDLFIRETGIEPGAPGGFITRSDHSSHGSRRRPVS